MPDLSLAFIGSVEDKTGGQAKIFKALSITRLEGSRRCFAVDAVAYGESNLKPCIKRGSALKTNFARADPPSLMTPSMLSRLSGVGQKLLSAPTRSVRRTSGLVQVGFAYVTRLSMLGTEFTLSLFLSNR